MNIKKSLPSNVIQFVKIYFTALLFFFLFRFILFISQIDRVTNSTGSDIFFAFVMGLRFDLVISGYILIVPYAILSLLSFAKIRHKVIDQITLFFIGTLFSVAFMICAIDIPYFNQFFSRLSVTAFEWLGSPSFVFNMVVQEPRYWLIAIPYFLFIYLFIRIISRIIKNRETETNYHLVSKVALSILFLGLIFLGIRGRIEKKSPIRIGTAYFCNDAFLNQLGLNPNFTLIRSYLDSKREENKFIQLIDDQKAIVNVQHYLNIKSPNKDLPISRDISFVSQNPAKYNVVIVLMESMSVAKMKRGGNSKNLTPFLDSISNKSYYFDNNYSAGIHTFNGVFSTLFSYPAIFRQQPMKESSITKYHGIFSTLKENGYTTSYFTTHDGQFDNIEGFLKANDCENVISQLNYPSNEVKTTLGVPDDFMFRFSMPILNNMAARNKPFIATFMTASDHGPYYLPEYFKPRSTKIKDQIVEYADYSLRKFIELSSKQKWFKNTIFVFVADHGAPIDGLYDLSLDYNHTPLMFYAPEIIKDPRTFSVMSCQTDVFPSIMGLLKLPYKNTTLGIDLFSEKRPYSILNADDKYGVIDNDWLLIVKDDKTKELYKYRQRDKHNYINENEVIVNKMNEYAQSNLQTFQYLLRTKKL